VLSGDIGGDIKGYGEKDLVLTSTGAPLGEGVQDVVI